MAEELDYQAVSEQLQRELEQARLTITKLRYDRPSFRDLNGAVIERFVRENYHLIALTFMAIVTLVYLMRVTLALFYRESTEKE